METTPPSLCIDLDGTLLHTDLLHESILALLSRNPLYLFLLPWWLLKGKARFKREIASRVVIAPETLPYDSRVLELLQTTSQRPRVLCTASDQLLAGPIAQYLGLFEEVLASDGKTNLGGGAKAAALVRLYGERGFDYAGNAPVDVKVWMHARGALVVNASNGVARSASAATAENVIAHFPTAKRGARVWAKAMRLHQWLKNLLVLVPLLASHLFLNVEAVARSFGAFVAFGLCASGTYLLNDLLDLTPDRLHPRKRTRPFAAGTLPVKYGLLAMPTLVLASFVLALAINPAFALALLAYCAMTLAYSFKLKRIVMIDVVLLAALYTIRIIAGTFAIGQELTFWLLAFSMFIFLSLALLKRYTELDVVRVGGKQKAAGRGYGTADLPLLQSLGASAGYTSVMVLALYINSPASLKLYTRPQVLWLLCPLLLYWISRAWIVAHRGRMHDDPVVFAATDRGSQIIGLVCMSVALAAL
ncbi:UbiA family prenyltransferase [Pseudoxanthomonas sp. X-1]|uniref:UbiA family prenyltransferase n=1 Tax=Pseudoxanthomonas sp. X-1 TaxID=2571115 RepID=UPI00110A5F7D|nr:UbiA family prenyltransferase [Pseudoxanthomonas sp. X-1]TMN19310.1 UbiA family prenyltransferase [Pseudoxanthomonas sp. X-1]UAY74168.1 UbiA family prenyltransferase [Pseudoxanthomonas sp. X-1]